MASERSSADASSSIAVRAAAIDCAASGAEPTRRADTMTELTRLFERARVGRAGGDDDRAR